MRDPRRWQRGRLIEIQLVVFVLGLAVAGFVGGLADGLPTALGGILFFAAWAFGAEALHKLDLVRVLPLVVAAILVVVPIVATINAVDNARTVPEARVIRLAGLGLNAGDVAIALAAGPVFLFALAGMGLASVPDTTPTGTRPRRNYLNEAGTVAVLAAIELVFFAVIAERYKFLFLAAASLAAVPLAYVGLMRLLRGAEDFSDWRRESGMDTLFASAGADRLGVGPHHAGRLARGLRLRGIIGREPLCRGAIQPRRKP